MSELVVLSARDRPAYIEITRLPVKKPVCWVSASEDLELVGQDGSLESVLFTCPPHPQVLLMYKQV